MRSLKESARWFLVRKLLEFHRWLHRVGRTVDVQRIEHMTEAVMTRVGLPVFRDGTGQCPQCKREVRMLIADAANMEDRRCLLCAPPSWIDLYCSSVERFLEKSAPHAN
jgi:hypothetical protein